LLFKIWVAGVCPSTNSGHNATLLEFFEDPTLGGPLRGADDVNCPSREGIILGRCEMGCQLYVYQSKTDKDSHERVFHPVERDQIRRRKPDYVKPKHQCGCGVQFKTNELLVQHRRQSNHRKKRKMQVV
jgi:hypothetical protein